MRRNNHHNPHGQPGRFPRFLAYMRKMHGLDEEAAAEATPPIDGSPDDESPDNTARAHAMGGNLALEDTGEKARDFKSTMKKLFQYLGAFKLRLIAVTVFAILSTAFSVAGPRLIGFIMTDILDGATRKAAGGSGIDFVPILRMAAILLGLYAVSALFSLIMGTVMTGVSQSLTYKLRKEVSEKIGRVPMKYFETRAYGEVLSRVTNDIDTMSQSLNQCITQVITSAAALIGIIVMMLSISLLMTLVAFLILPTSNPQHREFISLSASDVDNRRRDSPRSQSPP